MGDGVAVGLTVGTRIGSGREVTTVEIGAVGAVVVGVALGPVVVRGDPDATPACVELVT